MAEDKSNLERCSVCFIGIEESLKAHLLQIVMSGLGTMDAKQIAGYKERSTNENTPSWWLSCVNENIYNS